MEYEITDREITLAEALQMHADSQKLIAQIASRLNDNAKVQEGESPAEDPLRLLELLDAETKRLEELIFRINRTNAETSVDGETMTALLARRDALKLNISAMRDFLQEASRRIDRYGQREIKIIGTVDVPKLQKALDGKSQELRRLEMKIQRANWNTALK